MISQKKIVQHFLIILKNRKNSEKLEKKVYNINIKLLNHDTFLYHSKIILNIAMKHQIQFFKLATNLAIQS